MSPRGVRNNNPGNLRKNDTEWQGLSPVQTDPDFFQFIDPKWGIRAMVKVLESYQREGICTIASAINRWAPPSENQTQAYIDEVSISVGIDSGHIVKLTNIMQPLVSAIIEHENGQNPYPDELIQEAISLA